jgi:hypothetical protein
VTSASSVGTLPARVFATRRGTRAGDVDIIFKADRDAMQGAAESAGGLLFFEHFGLREGVLSHHRDPRVGLGIIRLDGCETGFGKLDGRNFFGANAIRCLLQRERGKISGMI